MPIRLSRAATRRDAQFTPVSPDACAPAVSASPEAVSAPVAPEPPGPPFLSLREAAGWLNISMSTLNRLIAQGDLGAVRVGKCRKVPASFLAAYAAKDILLPEQVAEAEQGGG